VDSAALSRSLNGDLALPLWVTGRHQSTTKRKRGDSIAQVNEGRHDMIVRWNLDSHSFPFTRNAAQCSGTKVGYRQSSLGDD